MLSLSSFVKTTFVADCVIHWWWKNTAIRSILRRQYCYMVLYLLITFNKGLFPVSVSTQNKNCVISFIIYTSNQTWNIPYFFTYGRWDVSKYFSWMQRCVQSRGLNWIFHTAHVYRCTSSSTLPISLPPWAGQVPNLQIALSWLGASHVTWFTCIRDPLYI